MLRHIPSSKVQPDEHRSSPVRYPRVWHDSPSRSVRSHSSPNEVWMAPSPHRPTLAQTSVEKAEQSARQVRVPP